MGEFTVCTLIDLLTQAESRKLSPAETGEFIWPHIEAAILKVKLDAEIQCKVCAATYKAAIDAEWNAAMVKAYKLVVRWYPSDPLDRGRLDLLDMLERAKR